MNNGTLWILLPISPLGVHSVNETYDYSCFFLPFSPSLVLVCCALQMSQQPVPPARQGHPGSGLVGNGWRSLSSCCESQESKTGGLHWDRQGTCTNYIRVLTIGTTCKAVALKGSLCVEVCIYSYIWKFLSSQNSLTLRKVIKIFVHSCRFSWKFKRELVKKIWQWKFPNLWRWLSLAKGFYLAYLSYDREMSHNYLLSPTQKETF